MDFVAHLSKDKKLKKIIALQDILCLKKKKNICLYLCYSIISQQLSTKVAKIISKRFIDLFNGKNPNAQQIVTISFEKLRGIGMSNAKANYVQNVARFELEHGMAFSKLNKMDDEEVIAYLTQIKGVGRWTVEMLLMFALGRENVFAADDLGIQIAMTKIYNLDATNKKLLKENMQQLSAKWHPYKTFACLYLWRWKDDAPVSKK